jgi:hypothetical protein
MRTYDREYEGSEEQLEDWREHERYLVNKVRAFWQTRHYSESNRNQLRSWIGALRLRRVLIDQQEGM